jgi:hypothetical protein
LSAEGDAPAGPGRAAPGFDTEVLIVGAGPVGLWLAAELCAAGVRALVIEAREQRVSWSRGFVVHPRTLEILDSRGAAAPLLESGRRLPTWHYAMGTRRLDFTALPSAFPYLLGIQDAHNLAWRLTAVVRAQRELPGEGDAAAVTGDAACDALLDGYEAERRPAAERVLEDVRAQMALVAATGADGAALRARFEALLGEHPEVNLQYARRLAGLEVRYPAPDTADTSGSAPTPDQAANALTSGNAGNALTCAHAADARLGARIPDLLLDLSDADRSPAAPPDVSPTVPTRLYELLSEIGPGRLVRLRLSAAPAPARTADDQVTGLLEEPVEITARAVLGPDWALRAGWGGAESVLVRPDGHVARIDQVEGAACAPPSAFPPPSALGR